MSNFITLPFEYFADPTSGRPVANGSIYIGIVDLDPTIPSNQIEIYYIDESENKVILSQPVSTNVGGYPVDDSGTVVQVRTDSQYSMTVQNKNGSDLFYVPDSKISEYASIAFVNETATEAQEQLLYGGVFPVTVSAVVEVYNGSNASTATVPAGTTHLRTTSGLLKMVPAASGNIVDLTETTAQIGGTSVELLTIQQDEWRQVGDIRGYGATPGGDNIYDAIRKLASDIQSNGGGRIYIPWAMEGYSLTAPDNNSVICDFSNLEFLILDLESKITIGNEYSPAQGNTLFRLTSCKNISGSGFNLENPSYVKTSTQAGIRGLWIIDDCENIELRKLKTNGALTPLMVTRDVTQATPLKAKNFDIDIIDVTNTYYGANFQYSGDNVRIGVINTNEIHRSYFIYGVKNHYVSINSRNNAAEDCAIAGFDGVGCENIYVKYSNTESTAPSTGNRGACVDINIEQGSTLPSISVMKNINIEMTVDVTAANVMAYGFQFRSTDAVAVGHVVENISLSGTMYSAWSTFNPVHYCFSYPATGVNYLRNFNIENFYVSGVVADSYINMRNQESVSVRNAAFPQGLVFYNGNTGSNVLIDNCQASKYSNSSLDPTRIVFTNSIASTTTNLSQLNKKFINCDFGGLKLNLMPVARATCNNAGGILSRTGVDSSSRIGVGVFSFILSTEINQGKAQPMASVSGGVFNIECQQWSTTEIRVKVYSTSGLLTDPANEISMILLGD